MNLENYKTMIFDCDGVILDSNRVKTTAFYNAALPYGEEAATKLVEYHVANGGISRYKKFDYFLGAIIDQPIASYGMTELLKSYADEVLKGLMSCEVSAGLAELRIKTKGTHWLVISGGDQQELREIFSQRGLLNYFDMGIYGSPSSKDEIIARESLAGKIIAPVLFFGDSQYDYEAAKRAGMDFAFVSDWSESKFDFSGADVEIRQLSDALKLLI